MKTAKYSKFRSTKSQVIAEYWEEQRPDWVIDSGEPACFACRYYEAGWTSWENNRLDRAHIIAQSIGGPDIPSNYLILCKKCHQDAPMVNDRELMLSWVTNREPYLVRQCREFMHEFAQVGGTEKDLLVLSKNVDSLMHRMDAVAHALKVDSHPARVGFAPSSVASVALTVARSYGT